jgi:hypothetical protein
MATATRYAHTCAGESPNHKAPAAKIFSRLKSYRLSSLSLAAYFLAGCQALPQAAVIIAALLPAAAVPLLLLLHMHAL